jgi:DNA-binding CsgD family transcriptional regulator
MSALEIQVGWAEGRWAEAIAQGERVVADGGCDRGTAIARTSLGYLSTGRGAFDRGRAHLDAALTIAQGSEEVDLLLPVLWGVAELELLTGDADASVRTCEAAFELAAATGERASLTPFVVTGIRAHHASGRPDEAERWLERICAHVDGPAASGAALDHAAGLVRLAAGSLGSSRDALERAVVGWEELGRTWEWTWARLDLASCLVRSNRHADAVSVLTAARATAVALDSEPLLARTDGLLRVARGRGMTEEPWRPLTVREFEVARLIGEGMTNAAIARELEIAPKTASSHVEHILAKLGATRRTEIATWVAAIGGRSDGSATAAERGSGTFVSPLPVRAGGVHSNGH